MPFRRRVHEGFNVTGTANTLLTFSANLVEGGGVVLCITLNNQSSVDAVVTVHLVPSGGSPSESNCIVEETVKAHRHIRYYGPWFADASAFVSCIAGAFGAGVESDVACRVTAMEEFIR